jgi:hypothetical protein
MSYRQPDRAFKQQRESISRHREVPASASAISWRRKGGERRSTNLRQIRTRSNHYRKSFLCRVPATHGERAKAHGKHCTVCLLSANNTRQRTPRRISYAVCIQQNPRRTICRVLPPHARESKVPNVDGDPGWAGSAVCRGSRVCRVPSPSRLP